jgi:hypothetical protein
MDKRILIAFAVICSISFTQALPSLFGTVQSAAVRGQLLCNGKPASGVKVKLYDEDDTDMDVSL